MTQQNPPFTVPPVNFWDGNQFVVPGYTQGYDLPAVPTPPAPVIPPVLPPVLPPIYSPYGYPTINAGSSYRPMGLLDMSYVRR